MVSLRCFIPWTRLVSMPQLTSSYQCLYLWAWGLFLKLEWQMRNVYAIRPIPLPHSSPPPMAAANWGTNVSPPRSLSGKIMRHIFYSTSQSFLSRLSSTCPLWWYPLLENAARPFLMLLSAIPVPPEYATGNWLVLSQCDSWKPTKIWALSFSFVSSIFLMMSVLR